MGAVSNIGAGISAGAAVPPEEDRFSIDPNAGYKGSFSGLSQGGVLGAIAGGITAQLGTFSRVNKNLRNLNTGVDGFATDAYGAPIYNSQAVVGANQTIEELQEGKRKINRSLDPATHVIGIGTKRKLRQREDELRRNVAASQASFSEANLAYQRQQLMRQAYLDQINNVYGVTSGYY